MNPDDTEMAKEQAPAWMIERSRQIAGVAALSGLLNDNATMQDARDLAHQILQAMMDAYHSGEYLRPDK